MRPVKKKTQSQIALEWASIANKRYEQIKNGKDLSYIHILTPCILELTTESNFASVIDIGCGAGFLTNKLSKKSKKIIGVDMCSKNISLAVQNNKSSNTDFVNSTMEDFAKKNSEPQFTLGISNMTLMTTLKLDKFLKAVHKVLIPKSHFVFTITHPFFWPLYWGYGCEKWFEYKKELIIEGTFKISLENSGNFVTTHIHRPLEKYISSLLKNGFSILNISEPFPNASIQAHYPQNWKYPRFLAIRAQRI